MDILKVPQLRRTRRSAMGHHPGWFLFAVAAVGVVAVVASLAAVGAVKSRRSIEAQVDDREAEAQPSLFSEPTDTQHEQL